jgi:hypothetical protein
MLKRLQHYRGLKRLGDTCVGGLMVATLHVVLEARSVAPAADHDDLAGVAVGLPDLQIDESVVPLDESGAPAERLDEFGGAGGGDA